MMGRAAIKSQRENIVLGAENAMNPEVEIVDRGRGWQLSTSRITVQDLVPYFQRGCAYDEITRWIPILTHEEIALVEKYYREHQEELDAQDRWIRAYREEQIRLQRLRFPEIEQTRAEMFERWKKIIEQRRAGRKTVKGILADINAIGQEPRTK